MVRNPWVVVVVALALLLTACGGTAEEPTPTVSVEQIQTQAVATFAADLTATALAMPTDTPTPTETASPTVSPTPAVSATPSLVPAGTGAAGSCYGLTYVSDVTIPDNTEMSPGEQFTKTWRVRNSGSCAWQAGFTFRFAGGEAMGGSSISLTNAVQTGQETNLSVALTAPSTAGTYRGNWRMTNASGSYFGDEVYVLIEVSGSGATSAPSATQAPTATATPTEEASS
jgi:hypothetical protein